jgi:patatin-like phospholipase/acyl hydrolase
VLPVTYRILSIDGGGIRGLLVAALLERLDAIRPNFLAQVDLFAGTSTGGILALGLAAGLTPTEGRQLYEEKGPFVFADSLWDNVKDLGFARGAQYSNENLREVLEAQLGDQLLGDLPKKVLIPTFDLDNEGVDPGGVRFWKAKFFHNYPGSDSDAAQRVVDVALRTAAAPSFFPTYQGYIDGGAVANNPSVCALAQALDQGTAGQRLGDIALLSVGTGRNPKFLTIQDADWGWSQWAIRLFPGEQRVNLPLLEILLGGGIGLADYQCARLLNNAYHRLDPILPEPIDLDDIDKMPILVEVAMQLDLAATIAWLEEFF